MSEFSQARLESRIMETVSTLIVNGSIKNHNLSTLTSVSRVELSPDNSHAKVYLTSFLDDRALAKSVQALNGASAFIQSRLSQVLRTKNTPVLEFMADNAFREGEKINSLIDQVMKDIHE